MKKLIKKKLKQISLVKKLLNYRNERRLHNSFNEQIKENTPVFIFQMGKVGSSSAFHSIKDQYHGICLRSHWFTANESDLNVRLLFKKYQKETFPIKIISMLREPISRNISAFFENFERDTGVKYRDHDQSLDALLGLFLKNYKHDMPLTWLDENIKEKFGIDVYKTPFPREGYDTFKNGPIELLLYKHDVNDAVKEEIISAFLQIDNFKLSNINIGNAKEYASTYKKFTKLALPESYLDAMLNSKYSTHFYTEDLTHIRRKWSKEKHLANDNL